MKRIISILTLTIFFIVSQMGNIHAFDMGMSHDHNKVTNKTSDGVLFCGLTDDAKNDQDGNESEECYDGILDDAYISKSSLKTGQKDIFKIPLALLVKADIKSSVINSPLTSIREPESCVFERTSYQNLIGIVKNLN